MESMHFAARLVIEQNMKHMTAFSARPDSPVMPIRESRSSALRRSWRRAAAARRAPSTTVFVPARGACN